MKRNKFTSPRRSSHTSSDRCARLLAAFDRSSLSAAAFARQQGLTYSTFCGWRHRRAKLKASPAFVQVELSAPPAPAGLIVELDGGARMRIESAGQIALATALIKALTAQSAC